MARNIEIKARIPSIGALEPAVAAIADRGPIGITQDDTFFRCDSGRLKLRAFSTDEGELIFYRRANQQEPKESFYVRCPTSTPDLLRDSLSLAYGAVGRVLKQRTLYWIRRTRVHLDDVRNLGHFMELEVVLEAGEPAETGVREARRLMELLGIQHAQLIEAAYVDLLSQGVAGKAAAR